MNVVIRTFLIDLARQKTNQTITYQSLSDVCHLQLNMHDNPNDRIILGSILGEISRYEYSFDRPLLSSLVVRSSDNLEGDGFYKLGEKLGFGDWRVLKRIGTFEIEQMKKCINFWTNNANYKDYC